MGTATSEPRLGAQQRGWGGPGPAVCAEHPPALLPAPLHHCLCFSPPPPRQISQRSETPKAEAMLNARRSGVTNNFRQLRRAGPPLRAGAAVCQWGRGRCREPSWLSACPGHSLPLADPERIFSGSCMVPRPSLQHSCAISCCFSASVRPQTARAERLEEKNWK